MSKVKDKDLTPKPWAQTVTQFNKAINLEYLNLEWISQERFEAAKQLRLKFIDKPMISFTDFTSMVVMKELEIKLILTADAHFGQVGLGFNKAP
jgi:predicted nucleic acid-binding protein